MQLIKDLGKKKDNKGKNRRYGLFLCPACNREVERRIDCGSVQKNCGCLNHSKEHSTFEEWECLRCKTTKPLTEFYKRKDTKSYRRVCKECVKEQALLRNFGVDYKWYTEKLEEQNYSCAICNNKLQHKTNDKFCVDHNHSTGEVRGLLCSNCNTAIGLLKENTEYLDSAKEYLNKYNEDIV